MPRTARRYTTDQNFPLLTSEDRLLLILVHLKAYPLQGVQWRLFGMRQSTAHQWIHVLFLLTVLQATLCALGDAPTQSVTELAKRIGGAEAEATATVVPTEGPPTLSDPPAPAPAAPLLPTRA